LEEPAVLACGVALLKALLDLSVDGLALGGILELVSLNNALEVDVQAVAVFFGYGQGHGLATFFFFLLLPAPPPPPPPHAAAAALRPIRISPAARRPQCLKQHTEWA